MATLLLSAAGAAIGSGFGGAVLGLSGAVIGRAVGATLGRVIDQRLLGSGSDPVNVGRVDRLRLTGAGEGAPISLLWGRMRLPGHVIWATEFEETVQRRRSGKGAPKPKVNEYSYSVSLAIALCEGKILRIGRIWADGNEISPQELNIRVYNGSETQLPDPKIEAVEGTGRVPAYRGTAYVVIEDLELAPFGNRVPQFNFEVVRPAQGKAVNSKDTLNSAIKAVALIPGTGEYALATTKVHYSDAPGRNRSANVNSPSGTTDFLTSFRQLREELPSCGSISLVVSWFGDDLRCSNCDIRPKVEQKVKEGIPQQWRAGGITRASAREIPKVDGRSIYGGTPSDASVIEAIRAIKAKGQEVVFYPFILMDQIEGNNLPDPWSDAETQPPLPWRGRITLSLAPGQAGTPDKTAAATAQVNTFFGSAQRSDFDISGEKISYSGPDEWRYRRFILHYAHLCALAGGVDAFCIGSEMRSLTQIRGVNDSFPAVAALRQLASDVRAILGPTTKISYAADWSEYFGYQTGSDVFFHLDSLWADQNIDFVGIDNYMPLSDWRDGDSHADVAWGSVYNIEYLKSNIAGGEGFDWFYDSKEGEDSQRRVPITDDAYNEAWIYRYKDIKSWWSNQHFNRKNGIRSASSTNWVPESKPIWFTEYGCPAIDKGTNQPNKFIDLKSSESALPKFSSGRRDDLIQMQYLRAFSEFWADPNNNPKSALYEAAMVDMRHAHVWAWDARPFPDFPAQSDIWSDGGNYSRGHWLNGRVTNQPLSAIVKEICKRSGVSAVDVKALYGLVRGYTQSDVSSARAALQPLMLTFGFDVIERDGLLVFRNRDARDTFELDAEEFAVVEDLEGFIETARLPEAETAGQIRLGYVDAQSSYEVRSAEVRFPDEEARGVSQTDVPIALTRAEGRATIERWLAESRVARDSARFALPKSRLQIGAGDVVRHNGSRYRIDRVEQAEAQILDAVRVEQGAYLPSEPADEAFSLRTYIPPVPVFPLFLDLPLLTGEEVPYAPHVAVAASPWPGSVAVWSSSEDAAYELNKLIIAPAVVGMTESPLNAARPGVWDRGQPLRVKLSAGTLSSATRLGVLNGANAMAIGDGSAGNWEIFQFANAQVVAPDTYELSDRLRGQQGTDGVMPKAWPIGSTVVLIDLSLIQIDLPLSARGLARYYRIGAASRGYDDPDTTLRIEAFEGIGLRPYPVSHIRAKADGNGGLLVRWTRRTRIDGDNWQTVEVPLGEETEGYVVRIVKGSNVISEFSVTKPEFSYPSSLQSADGVSRPFAIEVAQLSPRFGTGPFRRIDISV
jgi:hypothetical protein